MYAAFFSLGMLALNRQLTFRRSAVCHALLTAALGGWAAYTGKEADLVLFGQGLLIMSVVEGATLIGWRLTQVPKSRSLEFLLASPTQPRPVFLAEAAVGSARLVLISLTGLPILLLMAAFGVLQPTDIPALLLLPLVWGLITGLALTAWVYESRVVRRVGEGLALLGVLVYLVVGILAAERLGSWLRGMPEPYGSWVFNAVAFVRDYNPFGVVRYWLVDRRVPEVALERILFTGTLTAVLAVLAVARAAYRLSGHFHDRHFRPVESGRPEETHKIGHRPLSWWAVRRVMEYSGKVNLWLAGGFCLLYAAYLLAGSDWPAWMGRGVFVLMEQAGGAPVLITMMVMLAAVPAAFQYGLWDSSPEERAKRLELLMLTEIDGRDYWDAAWRAALRRGRGYLIIAGMLWAAVGLSGRASWLQVLASAAAAGGLWMLYFVVGFRAFAQGVQANGLGPLLTLGVPTATVMLVRAGCSWPVPLVPPGAVYAAVAAPLHWNWLIGPVAFAVLSYRMASRSIRACDTDLRDWLGGVKR